jgi:hypothetical protein
LYKSGENVAALFPGGGDNVAHDGKVLRSLLRMFQLLNPRRFRTQTLILSEEGIVCFNPLGDDGVVAHDMYIGPCCA